MKILEFLNYILDLIYKRRCVGCGCSIDVDILCKNCSKAVQNLPAFPHRYINGYPVYSAFYYEGAIKNIILSLKFKHNRVCADYAAKYLFDYIKLQKDFNFDQNTIIVPILTHKKNYNKRGYDNVLEIAKNLSVLGNCTLNTKILNRIKYTKPQYKLTAKQRHKNVTGAFAINKDELNKINKESYIILLDDICTTGATLEVATSLFKENGISNLVCFTLSKAKKF